MTWSIRRMNEADIDDVYAIETNVHIAPWSRNILRDCILVGYNCLVLETQIDNEKSICGYIICRHHDNGCHILNLCIKKSLQSKGYGRKLLQYVLDFLAQFKEITHVVLEVRPSNKVALHLYKTMGFQQIEIKQAYYKDNEKVEDAIFLKKFLPQQ